MTCLNNCSANKGFLTEMLGIGDFYFELGVQIVEICLKTRSQNGGLLDVESLREMLQQARPAQTIQSYPIHHIF
jgi:ESCRT-II complex subunit VPS22